MIRTSLAALFLLMFTVISASAGSSYMITFQTTDCNGDTGIASVEVNRIYKIKTKECEPPYQAARRKQVLVTSKTLHGSYDVFTVDEKEAVNIQQQIQDYMDARRKLLEKRNPIILQKD